MKNVVIVNFTASTPVAADMYCNVNNYAVRGGADDSS